MQHAEQGGSPLGGLPPAERAAQGVHQPTGGGTPGLQGGPSEAKTLREVASFEVSGEVRPAYDAQAISPGGRYVLAVLSDASGMSAAAIPLDGSGLVRTLRSVDSVHLQNALFGYHLLGWLSENRCVFAISGWQNSGPNKGKRGLAVLSGDVETGQAQEVAFIPMPEGVLRLGAFDRQTGRAQFTVSASIWECDVERGGTRLIKGGLPAYDGLFRSQRSPDGRYYVYELYEDEASGIFILDTATGEQKPLLPRGETWSFLPSWSPDGRYVAAYTAGLKPCAPASQNPDARQLFHLDYSTCS